MLIRQPIEGYERTTPWEFCWDWHRRHTALLLFILAVAVYSALTGCAAMDRWLYGETRPDGTVTPGAAAAIPVAAGAVLGPIGTAVAASALGIYAMFRSKRKEQ